MSEDSEKLAHDLTYQLSKRKEALLRAAVEYNRLAVKLQMEAISIKFRMGSHAEEVNLVSYSAALSINISPPGSLVNQFRRYPDLEDHHLKRDVWPERSGYEAEYLQTPRPDQRKKEEKVDGPGKENLE